MNTVGTDPDVAASDGPYVGLRPYSEENAALFFGRGKEQTVLISNLRAARLTLLYAKSGAGKSSLLRAGVAVRLAELAQRSLDHRGTARNIPVVFSSWRDDPTVALIGEIQHAITPFLRRVSLPTSAPDRLDTAIEAASKDTGAALLVILDEFEDYFLYQPGEVPDRPFTDELAACINRADLRAKFLISIREDKYSSLGDLFKGRISNVYGNYLHLEQLTKEAAREAIEKPIRSFNELHPDQAPARIERDLVDAILNQLGPDQFPPDEGGVGRLAHGNGAEPHRDEVSAPFLQLVMKRLWDTELGNGSRTLRLKTFKKLGEAPKIVRNHVDRALGGLPGEERDAAVDILDQLVTPSGTKLALTASDLAEYTERPADEVNAVLQRLVGSDDHILGTLPPVPGRADGTRYEILHDLLVPTIKKLGSDRKAARLERAKKAAEQEAEAEKQRAQAEKRSKLRFRAATIALAIVLLVVVLLAVIAVYARQAAVTQSHVAQSESMAAEATNLLPADGPLAMLLSLQAYERAPTPQAESAVIQAAQQPLDDLLVSGSAVRTVAFSPDGRTLAAGEGSGHVGMWDVATGRRTATLAEGNTVEGLAFSPDGKTLAVGDYGGYVGLWDVTTGQRMAALAEGSAISSVAFSPDGPLVTGDSLENVGIWNAANGKRFAKLAEGGAVTSLAFSPHGLVLAIGTLNGNIVLLRQKLTNLTQRHFMQLICGRVRENMTQAQWADYAPGQPYQKTCP